MEDQIRANIEIDRAQQQLIYDYNTQTGARIDNVVKNLVAQIQALSARIDALEGK